MAIQKRIRQKLQENPESSVTEFDWRKIKPITSQFTQKKKL
jgi:hypothetical protein